LAPGPRLARATLELAGEDRRDRGTQELGSGLPIRYPEAVKGPPLVLLHALGESAEARNREIGSPMQKATEYARSSGSYKVRRTKRQYGWAKSDLLR
jgi:hypothetical protein